jgi:hypothetical protein
MFRPPSDRLLKLVWLHPDWSTVLFGLITSLAGLGLALNFRGCAKWMAASYRRIPWWLRPISPRTEAGVRISGVLVVALGTVIVAVALRAEA